jgi:hypothetical protein
MAVWLLLVFPGALVRGVADFVSPYALSDFTLTNSAFADGFAVTPDGGHSIVLTGPNDGSGLPGHTDLTVVSRGLGPFHFQYTYNSADVPGVDRAGYLINGQFHVIATDDGQTGSISVPATIGDRIGFRIESDDNSGEPGVLTIRDFSAGPASVPAASVLSLILTGGLLAASTCLLLHSRYLGVTVFAPAMERVRALYTRFEVRNIAK